MNVARRRLLPALSLRAWTLLLAISCGLPIVIAVSLAVRAEMERQDAVRRSLVRETAESAAARIAGRIDRAFGFLQLARGQLLGAPDAAARVQSIQRTLGAQRLISGIYIDDALGRRILDIRADRLGGEVEGLKVCRAQPVPEGDAPPQRRIRAAPVTGPGAGAGEAGWLAELSFVPAPGAPCVAGAIVSMAAIGQALRQRTWEREWTASVVDAGATILARSHEAERFVGQVSTPPLREALAAGGARDFDGITRDGTQVLAHISPVAGAPGWHVAVGVAVTALDARMSPRARWLLGLGGLFTALGAVAAFFLVSSLRRSIRSLGDASQAPSALKVLEVEEVSRGLADAQARLLDAARSQSSMIGQLEAQNARLEESERALKALQQNLLEAQESERQRLARELHDELGQELALLHLMLQRTATGDPKALEEARALLDRLVERVRTIAQDLRPPQLEHLGLAAALRSLVRRTAENARIPVHADIADDLPPLGTAAETALFRVAQAAITNVLRHAQASAMMVSLMQSDGAVRLEVRDDGAGFDLPGSPDGLGLAVMRERIVTLGGTLEIVSSPEAGTRVIARLPLAEEKESP